jgi:hypothetical protein
MTRIACLLIVMMAAPLAHADPPRSAMSPEVKTHWDRALQLYSAHDYEAAITEFKAAFELDPRREFLFAWAQAERVSGDCPSAVVLYKRYLATDPPAKPAEAARNHLERCTQALSTRPEGAPLPEPQPTAADSPTADEAPRPVTVVVAPPPPPKPRGPWYRDVAGDALLSAGVVSLGAGASLFIVSEASAHGSALTYGDYATDTFARAERQRTIGVVGLGVGVALVTAALFRYWLR